MQDLTPMIRDTQNAELDTKKKDFFLQIPKKRRKRGVAHIGKELSISGFPPLLI
jgi:hypothetical protein